MKSFEGGRFRKPIAMKDIDISDDLREKRFRGAGLKKTISQSDEGVPEAVIAPA